MKKLLAVLLALFAVSAAFSVTPIESAAAVRDTPTPGPTSTPAPPRGTPSPSVTPIATVTPSATPSSTPTAVPSPTELPGVHDDSVWHPVSADVSHTHNANPADVNHIFGPVEVWFGGRSISYPWQTPNENQHKHEGYKWAVDADTGCPPLRNADNCVKAYRVLHHVVGGPVGAATRNHSYWTEALVCNPNNLSDCGIIRQGGWVSYQCLSVAPRPPDNLVHIPLPSDNPNECQGPPLGLKGPGYRHHNLIDDPEPVHTWNSNRNMDIQTEVNAGAVIAFSTHDDWQGIDPNDHLRFELICPDFQCEFNHSTERFHGLMWRDEYIALFDTGGRANYNGFSDRWGNPVEGCTEAGLDCVPLVLENMPLGKAQLGLSSVGEAIEFDLSPDGEFWIEYPN